VKPNRIYVGHGLTGPSWPVRHVHWRVVESALLADSDRQALRRLWSAAFGDRFSDDDADHAYGGVHVVASNGAALVAHASAVPRRIRFGDRWRDVGYVEAVATLPAYQRSGMGTQVMELLQAEIGLRWSVAMLSTGRATSFYQRLGWERWEGSSYTRTETGDRLDGEHGGLMVLRVDPSAVPDLFVDVTCEDRSGDAW
jgi:aminoglycoside 2'-N-acetyltransferase I